MTMLQAKASRWLLVCGLTGTMLAGVLFAGCGSSSTSSESSTAAQSGGGGEGGNIAVFEPLKNAFDACKNAAITETLEGAGYDVSDYYSEFDPATSNQNIEDAITKGTDGAILTALTPAADTTALRHLEEAEIPTVFTLSSAPEGTSPVVSVPVLAKQAGEAAVETMLEIDPSVNHVGVIPGGEGNPASDEPQEGIETALAANGLKAEAVQHGDFTPQGGAQVAQDMLQAHPDIEVIITLGDDMALSEAHAAATSGSSAKVIDVYGFGSEAVKAVADGKLMALIYAPLPEWGTTMAEAMIRAMKGEKQPSSVALEMEPIDRQSAASVKTTC